MKHILKEEEIIDIVEEENNGSLPVFYSKGWGESSKTTRPLFEKLSQHRRILSFLHPREIRKTDFSEDLVRKFSKVVLQKAFCILEVLERKGTDKVDAIGYSEGGLILAVAVYLQPERFNRIIMITPIGILGRTPYHKFAWGFYKNIKQNQVDLKMQNGREELIKITSKEFIKYVKKNLSLSFREARAMARADLLEIIKGWNKDHSEVVFIASKQDKLFDVEKIRSRLKKESLGPLSELEGIHTELKLNDGYQRKVVDILNQ